MDELTRITYGDTVTALPDPSDIQVATGAPEVEEYRAAWRRARDTRRVMDRKREHLDRIRAVAKRGTPRQTQILDRVRKEYQAAADAAFEADTELHEAEKAAARVAPDVLARLRASAGVYSQRLAIEHENHKHRLYR